MDDIDRKKADEAALAAMRGRSTLAWVAAVLGLGVCLTGLRFSSRVTWPLEGDGTGASEVRRGVDPNTAEWFELAQLPGVGPSLAKRIVEFRSHEAASPETGKRQVVFRRAGDLAKVKGIGVKTVRRIEPFVRL